VGGGVISVECSSLDELINGLINSPTTNPNLALHKLVIIHCILCVCAPV